MPPLPGGVVGSNFSHKEQERQEEGDAPLPSRESQEMQKVAAHNAR